MDVADCIDIAEEVPPPNVFIAPSICEGDILSGRSYTHHSGVPKVLEDDPSLDVVIGIDEAGRGPVLGPMVYGLFYLPVSQHHTLLARKHGFNDSKVLTPSVRSKLMETLCKADTDLFKTCGWATRVMSARDISSGMLRPAGMYNLNAQAMDATIDLIKEVFAKGVHVREIYVDTIGSPQTYQKRLERVFPAVSITVAKKADSLYPCVSAASVCAKVTRDAALEVCYQSYLPGDKNAASSADGWGSGYPSDARCTTWLKSHMDPLFGWGNECRFSWGTAKDLLDVKGSGVPVDWPEPDDEAQSLMMTNFLASSTDGAKDEHSDDLTNWFGKPASSQVF